MSYKRLSVATSRGVLRITLDRPRQMNCWDLRMNDELADVLDRAARDAELRVVVVTGRGHAFCAGGDIAEFKSRGLAKDPDRYISEIVRGSHEIILQVRKLDKPVIAAVNGVAAGSGFNLALACDIRIAARSARFSQRFVRVGLSPDTGGTCFLPQLVGVGKASELLLTGDFIDAAEAERLGLVTRVVDDDKLAAATAEWVAKFKGAATQALVNAKRLINQGSLAHLAVQLEAERQAMAQTARSADFREGVQAFLAKRPPRFTGR
ncbi:MAG: 2-(1,2-epoxy-1,2-dihydrophenyl)acetyl-CoA isomerase [Alphaproteobacteria bacterium]|nr:2-(1,2-epoxy-1,2-dihydrophenyl)acetyl-CoA isomerase [Alphaproteobacteria bacterium]